MVVVSEEVAPPINSEDAVLKIASIIIRHLREAANEIEQMLQPKYGWAPLTYKNSLVGRVREVDDRVELIPVESLKVKMDDRAVGWLQNKVLEKAREKHGWNYQVMADKDGSLGRIVIFGVKTEDVKDILGRVAWAFHTASERPSGGGGGK